MFFVQAIFLSTEKVLNSDPTAEALENNIPGKYHLDILKSTIKPNKKALFKQQQQLSF